MKLYSQKLGIGEPLIILHGLFGSSDNWLTIGKQLANHFTVYLIDLRNHGKSPHTNQFGYDNMALDVREFIQDHNLKSTILIGHSMGGKVAMKMALEYPMRINKLIVADIAPRKYDIIHEHIIEALLSIKVDELTNRKQADLLLAKTIENAILRKFLLKNLYRDNNSRFKWKINLKAICNYLDQLGDQIFSNNQFDQETLFIKGELSNYIIPSDKNEISSLFPKSEIKIVPNATHWLHAEQPEIFLKYISEFLRS
ncbi:alpha/beta fold hydrolase [Calditrichota bacterium]